MSLARFNFVLPGLDPKTMSGMYRAAIDMAGWADDQGFSVISLEEHHGADNGWSPSPLVTAGLVFGRTRKIGVNISALLVPLHDPLRIAEDIAVLDLASGGRLSVIAGLGYRPAEYAAHGKDWAGRGALMDEAVDTLLKAWTGEPFSYRGTTVRVTPRPLTEPHPMLFIGGTNRVSARRAARFGLPLFPAANLPELEAYYYEQCREHGTSGFCMMPAERTVMLQVAEDPDQAWSQVGHHLLHEATTYASWQTPDIRSAVHSHATTVDELRAEGIYQILSPGECIALAQGEHPPAAFSLHPLCGGIPIDRAWESLQLYADKVLPEIA